MQKKHIQLHACMRRVTAIENSSANSELLLIYMNVSFKLQLAIIGIAYWPKSRLILEWV